jgi:hypothetical protein
VFYKGHNCIGPREKTVILSEEFFLALNVQNVWFDCIVILEYLNGLLHYSEKRIKFFYITSWNGILPDDIKAVYKVKQELQ